MDEATSSVDPENEDELQRAIEALTHDKTIIMIDVYKRQAICPIQKQCAAIWTVFQGYTRNSIAVF